MRGILSDHNIKGHVLALIDLWEQEPWREFWLHLNLSVESFTSLGIPTSLIDSELWQICQAQGLVLFTSNRNNDSPDSLEATIRKNKNPTTLPVITIANPLRFDADREYAVEVAERALDYLLEMEKYLGAGRIFV